MKEVRGCGGLFYVDWQWGLVCIYSKLVLFNGPRRLLVFYYTQKPKLAKHLAVLLTACVLLFGFKINDHVYK
jgi:hypothetical protein